MFPKIMIIIKYNVSLTYRQLTFLNPIENSVYKIFSNKKILKQESNSRNNFKNLNHIESVYLITVKNSI